MIADSLVGPSHFVRSISHPFTHGFKGTDWAHHHSAHPFYLVAGSPWMGIFNSYVEAWVASMGFCGIGHPTGFPSWEAIEHFYFTRDSLAYPIPPPYLPPTILHVPRPGCWSQIYQSITYEACLQSSLDNTCWTSPNSNPSLPIHPNAILLLPPPTPPLLAHPPSHPTNPSTPPSIAHPPSYPAEDDYSFISQNMASVPSSLPSISHFIPSTISISYNDPSSFPHTLPSLTIPSTPIQALFHNTVITHLHHIAPP